MEDGRVLLVAPRVAQRLMNTGARVPCSDSTVSSGSSSERSQSSSNTDPALVLPGLLAPSQLLTEVEQKSHQSFEPMLVDTKIPWPKVGNVSFSSSLRKGLKKKKT